jgi:signal transduction histidine kinase
VGDGSDGSLERRLAELERRNEALERSNEDLQRFAHAAAHDLAAPLVRIEMALASMPRPDGEASLLVDVARRGATQMRQLIEDLLALAAVGAKASPPEPVDLGEVLAQVRSDLEPRISELGAEVRAPELPTVWGHRPLLGQLLQNLVGNALKFVRAGVAPVVDVSGTIDGDEVEIRVVDNGIGIDPAHRDEVFTEFTRLGSDDLHPGGGVGLATCARVVAHHGGRIWLDDGLDGGLAVVVRLPSPPMA